MTPDLYYLALTALLTALLWVAHVIAIVRTYGFYGPKEYTEAKVLDLPGWGQRCMRAHQNAVEQFAPFAALVLVAHLTGSSGETTALAAASYFWLRVAYTIVFWLGVPYLRTLLFVLSVLAILVIGWEVVS